MADWRDYIYGPEEPQGTPAYAPEEPDGEWSWIHEPSPDPPVVVAEEAEAPPYVAAEPEEPALFPWEIDQIEAAAPEPGLRPVVLASEAGDVIGAGATPELQTGVTDIGQAFEPEYTLEDAGEPVAELERPFSQPDEAEDPGAFEQFADAYQRSTMTPEEYAAQGVPTEELSDEARVRLAAQQRADQEQDRLRQERAEQEKDMLAQERARASWQQKFTQLNNDWQEHRENGFQGWAESSSTLQKIGAAIAAIAGGFMSPRTGGRNMGMEAINQIIAQHAAEERARLQGEQGELQSRQSMLQAQYNILGDPELAEMGTRIAAREAVIGELEGRMAGMDPRGYRAAVGNQAVAEFKAQQEAERQKMAEELLKREKDIHRMQMDQEEAERKNAELAERIRAAKAGERLQGWSIASQNRRHREDLAYSREKDAADREAKAAEGQLPPAEAPLNPRDPIVVRSAVGDKKPIGRLLNPDTKAVANVNFRIKRAANERLVAELNKLQDMADKVGAQYGGWGAKAVNSAKGRVIKGQYQRLMAAWRKEMSGAAVSEKELKSLEQALPPPESWTTRDPRPVWQNFTRSIAEDQDAQDTQFLDISHPNYIPVSERMRRDTTEEREMTPREALKAVESADPDDQQEAVMDVGALGASSLPRARVYVEQLSSHALDGRLTPRAREQAAIELADIGRRHPEVRDDVESALGRLEKYPSIFERTTLGDLRRRMRLPADPGQAPDPIPTSPAAYSGAVPDWGAR